MPVALTFAGGNSFYDWRYESDPDVHMGGRRQESGFPLTDGVNGCRELGLDPLEEDLEPQRVS